MTRDTPTLDPHYAEFIKRIVNEGRYPDATAALNAAVQLLEDYEQLREMKLARLRAALKEGDDGEAILADEFMEKLKVELEQYPD